MSNKQIKTELVVLGSGPGGYTAAFRAADLGKQVTLVERYDTLGGVCLNVGCIPSKALLHVAKVIDEAKTMSEHGIAFSTPKIDTKKLLTWKESIVQRLTGGLNMLAKQRGVQVVTGVGEFTSANQLSVDANGKKTLIDFEQAIIAAGSQSMTLPFVPEDPRIFSSTGALELPKVQGKLLVIGGGIIGLEMATIYSALDTSITVVEFQDQLMPGADADLVKPLHQRIEKEYEKIMLKTQVTSIEANKSGLMVSFKGDQAPDKAEKFDQILLAVGRKPNGQYIGAEHAGVQVDERGFIAVDKQMRTNVDHIYAIGDIVGQPMLAHKAVAEGKVAAEVIAGKNHTFEPRCIPSVAYTDPEVAWAGLTENEAKQQGIDYGKGIFPWAANGRSLSQGRQEGMTKALFDNKTQRILGVGMVGPHAGDLIAEAALAIEMACDVEDIALTIHPHPTLSETLAGAAEVFAGTVTDLPAVKKK